jgi:hypothetical protein
MYARDGQALYIVPAQPDRKVWWRNLHQPTPVRLRLQGRDMNGAATANSNPEAVATGLRRYLARYQGRQAAQGPAGCQRHPAPHPPRAPTRWSWSWWSTLTAASTARAAAKGLSRPWSSPLWVQRP